MRRSARTGEESSGEGEERAVGNASRTLGRGVRRCARTGEERADGGGLIWAEGGGGELVVAWVEDLCEEGA